LNLAAISGAALEVSGDLRRYSPDQLRQLQKTLELSDPRRRVWCPNLLEATAQDPPALWFAEGDADLLVGIFNWRDKPVAHPWPDLPNGPIVDVWSGESADRSKVLELGPHASRLLRVAKPA